MSGGQVAYHLRPNKAIDRQIFVELLTRFHGYRPIHDYTYVGFGGPFLEDFKLVDSHFGVAKMISLEGDAIVIERQTFNRPFTSVECRKQLSGEFISKYSIEVSGNAIVWLDFAQANARGAQLAEFQSLVEKMRPHDIVKLTLNASASSLPKPPPADPDKPETMKTDAAKYRFDAAETQLGDLWDPSVTSADMTKKLFPGVVLGAALRAARKALAASPDLEYVPLTSFVYADSEHDMLTLTGAVVERRHVPTMKAALRLARWDLAYRSSEAPIKIAAPMLSTRERVFLEAQLPKYKRSISKRGKFLVGKSAAESAELLQSFARFYRYYPHFGRIVP